MTFKIFFIIIGIFLSTPLWADRGTQGESSIDELREAFLNARSKEGTKLGDWTFFDENGVEFSLDSLRDNKPLVIGYIFTTCPDVCPIIVAGIEKTIKGLKIERLRGTRRGTRPKGGSGGSGGSGQDLNVLIFGFDAKNDTPEKLKKYRERFPAFRFASASAAAIRDFTESAGFFYRLRRDGNGFDHIDMVTLVDAQGYIYRQSFGIRNNQTDFADALRELAAGRAASDPSSRMGSPKGRPTLIDKLKYFCYTYDPYTDAYSLDYARLLGLALEFSVIMVLVTIVWGKNIKGFFRRFYNGT